MYKDPTSIFDNNRLDIDDNDTLRGDKSMYKGVDRLGGREPVNNAYNDGDMRESNMNTPNTEGGYPSNTSDAHSCLLYTSPSPRDRTRSRMPSSA